MRGLFQYDNVIFSTLEKILNMVVLSAMWLLFCLPVFTAGASTTALYYSVQKWLKNERGYAWSCFWDSFKENFKQATLVNLLFLLITFVVATDYSIVHWLNGVNKAGGVLQPFFIVLLLVICVYAFWFFASLARFQNTTKNQMKNALFLMACHWPVSLYILAVSAGSVLLLYLAPYFIIILPVLSVWFISLMTEKVFRRYMTDEDKRMEDIRNNKFKNDYTL